MSQSIEDVPLDDDISSHEGVSLDHTARSRIAFLLGQNKSMVAQTQFADAKAGALLAVVGVIATGGLAEAGAFDASLSVVFVLHAVTLSLCFLVLFPRYASHGLRSRMVTEERYSWPALAADDYDADRYADYMRHAEVSQLVVSIARSNHALSRILLRKFAMLRAAFAAGALDVVALVGRAVWT
ncbi:MAG: hypothetical protein AAF322_03155, partial [Pseudomonadota bacterium]